MCSGSGVVAIDSKIEQAMVGGVWLAFCLFVMLNIVFMRFTA